MKKILITLFTTLSTVEALANEPKNWQLGFQEAASQSMRDIVNFHDKLLLKHQNNLIELIYLI